MIRYACRSIAVAAALAVTPPALAAEPSPTIAASVKLAVVQTGSGEVQGFVRDAILSFRGIPYATAERFMPPVAPVKWATRRLALSFGNSCPQPIDPALREPQTFIADTHYWPASEACQNLNIWTPGTGKKKRPVMVWLHGGGFFSGSSAELGVYDGTNLSRKGDVVVVSLDHRLNVLGFLDLSAQGDAYKQSANVGMLDIVRALEWVRDNIAAFGGNPERIVALGTSAGAVHVATHLKLRGGDHGLAGAVLLSGLYGYTPLDERDMLYYGAQGSYAERMPRAAVVDTDVPLLIACAEHDPQRFQTEFTGLLADRLKRHANLPRALVTAGHNHYSLAMHLGTVDARLSTEIAAFVDEVSA